MKKVLALILALLMVCSMTACSFSDEDEDDRELDSSIFFPGNEREEDGEREFDSSEEREPLSNYDRVGVSNTFVSDGRYIYYSFKENGGGLCRTDMNGENVEELYDRWLSDLYIDDGYLYYGHGVALYRVDISTGPRYFDGSDGDINGERIVDKEMLDWRSTVGRVRADDEYIYFDTSGLCRVKKETWELEDLAYGEDFVNFHDLTIENGYLYAYCSDDGQLYRMNLDGSNVTAICELPRDGYQLYDGYAYCTDREGGKTVLTRTGMDDGETEQVDVLDIDSYLCKIINAMDDTLYYGYMCNEKGTSVLGSYDLTTGEDCVIFETDGTLGAVNIVGDFIFFYLDGSLMRVNADGSGMVQVG